MIVFYLTVVLHVTKDIDMRLIEPHLCGDICQSVYKINFKQCLYFFAMETDVDDDLLI